MRSSSAIAPKLTSLPVLVACLALFAAPAAAQIALTQAENPHDRGFERLPDLNLVRGAGLKDITLDVDVADGVSWSFAVAGDWMTATVDGETAGPKSIHLSFDRDQLGALDAAAGSVTVTNEDTMETAVLEVLVDVWPKLPPQDPTPAELRAFLKSRDTWPSDSSYAGAWQWWGFVPDDVSHPGENVTANQDAWEVTECPAGQEDRDDCVSPNQAGLAAGMSGDAAWLLSTGDPRVKVAVLDSGIKWDERELLTKHYLNAQELRSCPPPGAVGDEIDVVAAFDVNGDGVFNIRDYDEADWAIDLNRNGVRDPQDLIYGDDGGGPCSDGVDDDGNGYLDDISGWDFFWDDNDPSDDTSYGHGTGEARDSGAEAHNEIGELGLCPRCMILNVRVGDSFIVDANQFADGVVFAVESGAQVVQEALGSLNNTPYMQAAIDYAYFNGVAVIASAADERAYHHNYPGNAEHTLYVHAIVPDTDGDWEDAATFLNFGNCTNYGAKLTLSTPGTGCSSEATGNTSGQAGLTYSYFEQMRDASVGEADEAYYTPNLTAEELFQLLKLNADDIDIPGMEADPAALEAERYPSNEGWDLHFGYGRNNARRALEAIRDHRIPPEADISSPRWFEVVDPTRRPTVEVTGTVSSPRLTNLQWSLSVADGVLGKNAIEIANGTGPVQNGALGTIDLSPSGPLGQLVDRSAANAGDDPWKFSATLILEVTGVGPSGTTRGEFRKAFAVRTDPTMHEGFPIWVGASGESSPKLSDLDGDGTEEIIVATSDGLIHAYTADGNELPGFPVTTNVYPALSDENCADPTNQACYRRARAYQAGTPFGIDPATVYSSVSKPTIAIGDLDGDGAPGRDVVVATVDGTVLAYSAAGELLPGFPVALDRSKVSEFIGALTCVDDDGASYLGCRSGQRFAEFGISTTPVLTDLNGDGSLEIVVGAMDQHAYAWHFDGATVNGWPVLLRNVDIPAFDEDGDIFRHDGRIVSDPIVADLFGDGTPIVVMGSNERREGSNQANLYGIWPDGDAHPGGPFPAGWPVKVTGFIPDEILPFVGRGMPNSAAAGDYDDDGKDEVFAAGMGGFITIYNEEGGLETSPMNATQAYYGINTNVDEPAGSVPVINNPSVADIDGDGRLDVIDGTAGFGLVAVAQNGGKRAEFDHSVSAWIANNGYFLDGFPHRVWDYQFFMNYSVADLDNSDGLWNVISGDGGYHVYAPNAAGQEAPGFPKFTMQWHIGTPAIGDLDGDGFLDVVANTREGWLYAWRTEGTTTHESELGSVQWAGFHHDDRNTGNFSTPLPDRGTGEMGPPDDGDVPLCACDAAGSGPEGALYGLLAALGGLGTLLRSRRRRRG